MLLANAQKLVRYLIGFSIATIVLYFAVLAFVRIFGVLALPYQAEYGEGPVLDWARQIANGTLPYKPIDTFPYNFSVYTPAYLATSAVFIHLIPANPWFGGRFISLMSAIGLAWLIYVAGRVTFLNDPHLPQAGSGSTRKLTLPTIAIVLWLVSPYVFRWATFYRPDMFALFWSGLGIFLIYRRAVLPLPRADLERNMWGWAELLPALCFVISFYSKQSFFAAPLAAVLYLAVTNRRAALRLVSAGALIGGVVTLGLWVLVGRSLFDNLIAANANAFSWEALQHFWGSFLTITPILIVLALFVARRRENWLWGAYLFLAALVSISIGKAGAWENYFLEPLWIMCVLVARSGYVLATNGRPRGLFLQGGVAVLLLLQLLLYTRGYERLSIPAELAWLEEVRTEGQALQEAVAALPPDIPVYSEQMGVLAELNRPVPLHSFVYTQLERQGLWDDHALTTRLAGGEGVVIQRYDAINDPLARDRWSRAMLDAIEQGYGMGPRVGEWLVRTNGNATEPITIAPRPLDNGFTLEGWQSTLCDLKGQCGMAVLPVTLMPDTTLIISTLWRSAERINTPLSISVKLFDPSGQLVDQKDGSLRNGWQGSGWEVNALVRDVPRELTLPSTLPDGVYTLDVTLYDSDTAAPRATTRLPFFKVPPSPSALATSAVPHAMTFAERFTLLVHTPLPTGLIAGDTLTLETQWRGDHWSDQSATTFLHIVAPDGTVVAQTDFVPAYPPTGWSDGEEVTLSYLVDLPADSPAGVYRVVLGWYDSETFARLPIDENHDSLLVATVQIGVP